MTLANKCMVMRCWSKLNKNITKYYIYRMCIGLHFYINIYKQFHGKLLNLIYD